MKNYVQDGENLTVTAPYALPSGGGCKVGLIFGVATTDAAIGAAVELQLEGVVDLTALGTDTGIPGDVIYWDDANKRLTTTSAGNTKVGVLTAAKANGATSARVRLNANF
jgi:predicted RecA/RadA family phage recombinase